MENPAETKLLFPIRADTGATPSQEQLQQVKSSKQKGPLNRKLTTFITRKLGLAAPLLFVREGSWGAGHQMNCFQCFAIVKKAAIKNPVQGWRVLLFYVTTITSTIST